MDFDTWSPSGTDTLRVKRLLLGYFVGAIAVVATGAFIFLTSPNASANEEEEPEIEVQLAREAEPEPEPPPPPPAEEKPKPKPRVKVPIEIPMEAPKEAEPLPQPSNEPDPFEEEKPAAPVETAKPAVVEAPKPPPPPKQEKPKGPTRVLEDDTPPELLTKTKPEYPASAKAAGIEGVVIVRYVVSETGVVTDAKVIKGPAEFQAVCLATVKAWRFKPALDFQGKPKAVVRMTRFPFKLKT
jgi:protein TonB